MRHRTIAVVVTLALASSACGARFKGHEDSGAAVGTSPRSGPAPSVTSTTVGSGETGPGPTPGVTDTQITIGYLLPITGAAPIPVQFDRGVNAYWSYINAKGGIGGRKVKVIIEDTQSQAEVGKDKAKKLIEDDHVFAIVVLDRLENQQAIGEYLNSRRVPNIEIQAPADLGQDQVWSFGVTIDHAVQGKLVADYFVKVLHAKKVAIVSENTPTLDPGRNAFTSEMKKLGADIAYAKTVEGQANDFSNEALALSNSGATAVWLYMAPTTAASLANQADASGFHPTWFANSISWAFDLTFLVGPKSLKGARVQPVAPALRPAHRHLQAGVRQAEPGRDARRSRPRRLGRRADRREGPRERRGPKLGQNSFRDALQHLHFRPDVWAPIDFKDGVREGANVVAVLKEDGGHWVLEHDFTGRF